MKEITLYATGKGWIAKKVTFHAARHTFATTITLENGLTIDSVSKKLGHASIRTTETYPKVKKNASIDVFYLVEE